MSKTIHGVIPRRAIDRVALRTLDMIEGLRDSHRDWEVISPEVRARLKNELPGFILTLRAVHEAVEVPADSAREDS